MLISLLTHLCITWPQRVKKDTIFFLEERVWEALKPQLLACTLKHVTKPQCYMKPTSILVSRSANQILLVTNSILKKLRLIEVEWTQWSKYALVNYVTFGSDNGLSPGQRQAIIWSSVGILIIGPLGTIFSEILIGIQTFSIKKMKKMHLKLKMSSVK